MADLRLTAAEREERRSLRAAIAAGKAWVDSYQSDRGTRYAIVTVQCGGVARETRWVPASWVEDSHGKR